MIFQHENTLPLTPRQFTSVLTVGFMAVIFMGVVSTIVLLFFALWLVFQFCFLALASVIEAAQSVGSLYSSSDSMIRFLILVSLAYGAYRAGRHLLRKRGNQ